MQKIAYIIHGWDGYPENGWFPWLKRELEERGWLVIVPQLPKPEEPRINNWVPALKEIVGTPNEQNYFVGHSMGCQTIARYIEDLPEDARVGGAVFVAGFFKKLTNLNDDEITRSVVDEWLKNPVDLEQVKKHLPKSVAIFSDNDPYVPLENRDEFENLLGSKIIVEHDMKHFSGSTGTLELPVALEALLELSCEDASSSKSQSLDDLACTIWNYHHMHHKLRKADAIFVLGSNDLRVAERGVELFQQGYAPYLVFSGGSGVLTKDLFGKSEAETFADVAKKAGVPEDQIIIEPHSTNTGENILFTKELLKEKGLDFNSFILVQKPYMERRTYATFMKQWPGKEFVVTSPQIAWEEYPTEQLSRDLVINIMVGDLQRIKFYPEKGFQIPQEITEDVWSAYEQLVALGYTKHLMKD